jgi:TonB-linked SusC/RagA family outer membrane protein
MKYIHKIVLFIGLIALGTGVAAQNNKADRLMVSGQVLNATNNKPIEVASVSCGNFSSTFTSEEGKFDLEVKSLSDVLVIAARGFHTKHVYVAGKQSITVYLVEEGTMSYQETAHFGFYSKKQIYTTQSVGSVSSLLSDKARLSSGSSENVFEGRIAGLDARARNGIKGAGSDLFLRGYSSIYGTNQPLIIVDGMIYETQSFGSSSILGYRTNPLAGIDENDIENVTIVRDATSIYGAKASNGVIYIRTSHATKQATEIDLIVSGSYEMAPEPLPLMGSEDYRTYLGEMILSAGVDPSVIMNHPFMVHNQAAEGYYAFHNNTDWQKKVFANNYSSNYSLKIKGGDDIALYALSVGYLGQNGIVQGSNNSRFNFRFNSDIKFSPKVTLNSNISFNYTQKDIVSTGIDRQYDAIWQARYKAPFLNAFVQNAEGVESPDLSDYDFLGLSNPTALIENVKQEDANYRLFGSFNFNWVLAKNLTLSNLVGLSFDKDRQSIFVPDAGVAPITVNNGIIQNQMLARVNRHFVINNDFRIRYNRSFGINHNLDAIAGARLNTNQLEEDWAADFNSANDQIRSLSNGNYLLRQKGGMLGDWTNLALYLNADYAFKQKYLITLSAALDGSSRYGIEADGIEMMGTRFGIYPGVAAAWIASAEPFMANISAIEFLKLRASYGLTGNDDIGNYTAKKYYVEKNLLGFQGTMMGNLWNPALGAEKTAKMNFGADLSLWNERINTSFDVFSNKTTNLFDFVQANTFTGFSGYYANIGGFTTSGFDLSVNSLIINKPVKWEIGFVISKFKTAVDELFDEKRISKVYNSNILTEVGKPIGVFYGYKTLGVFESDQKAMETGLKNRMANESLVDFRGGDVIFDDFEKDNIIDSKDMQVIGDPTPDFTGEVFTRISYKRISLNASLGFSYGGEVFNQMRYSLERMYSTNNQTEAVLNRWRYSGQVTNMPRAEYGDPMNNSRFSDRWIEDGSYARLKNVTISYKLPIKESILKNAEVYASGINLFTFTNYLGMDPEFSLNSFSLAQGIDAGMVPQNRMVMLGIKIGL